MSDYEWYEDDEPYIVVEQQGSGIGPLLLGVALGAGIALLFAPHSGVDTRRMIRNKAREAKDTVADVVDEVASTVTDSVDLKKRQISRAVRAGRDAAHEAREDLEFRIAETKAAYKEI